MQQRCLRMSLTRQRHVRSNRRKICIIMAFSRKKCIHGWPILKTKSCFSRYCPVYLILFSMIFSFSFVNGLRVEVSNIFLILLIVEIGKLSKTDSNNVDCFISNSPRLTGSQAAPNLYSVSNPRV